MPHLERFLLRMKQQCSCFAPIAHSSPENLFALHAIYQEILGCAQDDTAESAAFDAHIVFFEMDWGQVPPYALC